MDEYPLLNLFWTIMVFFIWILWFFLLFRIITDIFRSHDLGGWGKTAWLVVILVLPFLGVFIYLIVRGGGMSQRELQMAQRQDEQFKAYVRDAAETQPHSKADELAKLSDLRSKGVITDEEFQQAKVKVLG